ncbi:MAG: V-type ATP synthase subunit F [Candidatus Aerophobetes bacterium]|nr:V-type ATP synthase subunit F [Candidatus Aerophobetes bacterium]
MFKIAIIADKESSLPFLGTGIETIICEDSAKLEEILRESVKKEYGIIFITESLAAEHLETIEKTGEEKTLPLITIIPDFIQQAPGVSEKRLEGLIKRAVGIELK